MDGVGVPLPRDLNKHVGIYANATIRVLDPAYLELFAIMTDQGVFSRVLYRVGAPKKGRLSP